MQVDAARAWVGLKELITTRGPEKVAHLVEGQLRLLELIAQPRSLQPMLEELAHVLEDQIDGMVVAVMLASGDGSCLRLGAAPSMPASYASCLDGCGVSPRSGWCGAAAHFRKPVIVADIERDPLWSEHRAPALAAGFRACWAVPILSASHDLLGAICMYHPQPLAPSAIHLGLITFATALTRIAIMRDESDREHERLWDAERFAERYRMVLRATREAVWDWDLVAEKVNWNDGLEALGYKSPELARGLEWWLERIHPDDLDRVRQSTERALADTQCTSWEDEYRFRRSDGTYAQVVDRAVVARDGTGKAVRMVGSMEDITRRKLHAMEIQQLAERLRAATTAARVGTWQLDAHTDLFRADESLNRLLGHELRDTVEPFENVLRCVHPDDRAQVARARDDSLTHLRPYAVEHRVVLEDGEVRWLRNRGRVQIDRKGQALNITGAVADITDLKHAEQSMALLADASRLLAETLDKEQILAAIASMAVPTFADGALVSFKHTETGEPDLVAVHAADSDLDTILCDILRTRTFHVGAPAHRVLRTGQSELHPTMNADWLSAEDVDERIIPLIRRFRVSSAIFVPVAIDSAPTGVIAFFSTGAHRFDRADLAFAEELARRAAHAMHNAQLLLTAKRERARAQEAQELRERLLAIVGHDLRNPLAAIGAATEVLKRMQLGAKEGTVVKRIASSAARMSRLIGQVLDFARIRQGMSLPIDLQPADLHGICQAVVDELRLANPTHELRLELQGRGEVRCDADRIAEAVSNLVGNAIQHGTEGPISVSVHDVGADKVAIEVHNLGAIPAEAQATVFDAYRREPSADAAHTKSIGLGLYIANEIVKAHQGMIGLTSHPGEGTTFTVLLTRQPNGRNGHPPRPV